MLGMLFQAIKGIAEDVKEQMTLKSKVHVGFRLTTRFIEELLNSVSVIPYGVYSKYVWTKLPKQRWNATMHRSVRYGPTSRNLLDIYVPETTAGQDPLPVVLFVHGGVWASGDKYMYSPLGAMLAHHGVLALIMNYNLYPQILAADQVKEVSKALTWVMDNVSIYGGDPRRVHLMGHSSGGHLCSMVYLERTMLKLCKSMEAVLQASDPRQPRCILGLSGVYDMVEHYKHEGRRGVASMSCLRPAMGGEKKFESMSPVSLFGSILKHQMKDHLVAPASNRSSGHSFQDGTPTDSGRLVEEDIDWSQLDEICPILLIGSVGDIVVPPTTSITFHKVLQELGCKSGVSLYENMGHDDFVLWVKGWGYENKNAQPMLKDLLNIFHEVVPLPTTTNIH